MITSATLDEFVGHNDSVVVGLIRKFGFREPSEVEDIKQDFYVMLLTKDVLVKWDPRIGSFNTYIGVKLKRFLINRIRHNSIRSRHYSPYYIMSDEGEESIISDLSESKAPNQGTPEDWWKENEDIRVLCKQTKPYMAKLWGNILMIIDAELIISLFVLGYKENEVASLLKLSGFAMSDLMKKLRDNRDLMIRLSGLLVAG